MNDLHFRFERDGYVVIKDAFDKQIAGTCRQVIWDIMKHDLSIDPYDFATWQKKVSLDKIWTKEDGYPWSEIFTAKLTNVIDSILIAPTSVDDHINIPGHDGFPSSGSTTNQCVEKICDYGAGWWMITMPGFSEV